MRTTTFSCYLSLVFHLENVVQWNHARFGVRGVSKRTGSNPVHVPCTQPVHPVEYTSTPLNTYSVGRLSWYRIHGPRHIDTSCSLSSSEMIRDTPRFHPPVPGPHPLQQRPHHDSMWFIGDCKVVE
ncbi:hypothetical protein E2C01_100656 [Portunus trituberculatus]|uniref:Uncharacterized protein n=1 Tax=Portunus trituberculatus TaxID=210409 RepID=A0A5B7K3P1_PORTR|nr:hypothetical protein [Portunus trituberculatus]